MAVLEEIHSVGKGGKVRLNIVVGKAVGSQDRPGGHFGPTARRSYGNPFSSQIGNAINTTVGGYETLDDFRIDHTHGAPILLHRLCFKVPFIMPGRMGNIIHGHPQFRLTAGQEPDILHRSTRGLNSHVYFLDPFTHHVGNGPTQGIVGAAGTTGPHEEFHYLACSLAVALNFPRRLAATGHDQNKRQSKGKEYHQLSSFHRALPPQ